MNKAQRGVAAGMAAAALTGVAGIVLGIALAPAWLVQPVTLHSRLSVAAIAMLAPVIALLVCVARLAKHRFFTPEDIDGSALTPGTDRARLLQALLQNTLEQTTLAVPTYVCCAVILPEAYLGAVITAAAMFLVGRVCFFSGYAKGAPSRAFGFALTFYPTALLAGICVWCVAMRSVA